MYLANVVNCFSKLFKSESLFISQVSLFMFYYSLFYLCIFFLVFLVIEVIDLQCLYIHIYENPAVCE